MKIAMSPGHGAKIAGAIGYIDEHQQAVRVVNRTAEYLRPMGVEVETFEETKATTQDQNLKNIVHWHNDVAFGGKGHDYDCFVHFNANATTSKPVGTECWYVTQKS